MKYMILQNIFYEQHLNQVLTATLYNDLLLGIVKLQMIITAIYHLILMVIYLM